MKLTLFENSRLCPGAVSNIIKVALALLVLTHFNAHAQSYWIDWFSVDGGAGTSTGGGFSLTGTIGQSDAGAMSSGNYAVEGGFWGILQTPGAPRLFVERANNAVHLTWPLSATGFVLDQSLTVTGTWSQVGFPYVTNATEIGITVPAPVGNKFYRLRR